MKLTTTIPALRFTPQVKTPHPFWHSSYQLLHPILIKKSFEWMGRRHIVFPTSAFHDNTTKKSRLFLGSRSIVSLDSPGSFYGEGAQSGRELNAKTRTSSFLPMRIRKLTKKIFDQYFHFRRNFNTIMTITICDRNLATPCCMCKVHSSGRG